MARILIADDEDGIRSFLRDAAVLFGHEAAVAADGAEAWQMLRREAFDVLITDLNMPAVSGLELLRTVKAQMPGLVVLVLTAHGTVSSAVEAMKLGALDYLEKPLGELEEIRALLDRAAEVAQSQRVPTADEAPAMRPFLLAFGAAAMQRVESMLLRVARTNANVLLLGESGVGKEKAAEFVHRASPRASRPFVAVNCASLSDSLLESELFGHQRGAFTGAHESRAGKLEAAAGGTFFLDEIGELRPELQARLLRVIETRRYERVGSTQQLEADVRWVAATNRNLRQLVEDGRFRADLYHRLATFPVVIPPLRERRDDIVPLARLLLAEVARDQRAGAVTLSEAAEQVLESAQWPGNVRELRNTLERAVVLSGATRVDVADLTLDDSEPMSGHASQSEAGSLEMAERETIARALHQTKGNRRLAAETLGISLRALYYKLRRFGLEDIR